MLTTESRSMVSNDSAHIGSGYRVSNPATEPLVVDVEACQRVAALLRSQSIPKDHEDSSLPGFTPLEVGNFYLLLAAISHQTSPQGKEPLEGTVGQNHLRGWDYLSAKLESGARVNRSILLPAFWEHVTAEYVRYLFRDKILGDRLSDAEGRAELIRDLGRKLPLNSWKSANDIYDASGGFIDARGQGLVHLLARLRAYSDPVHKKTYFLLALMRNAGLWAYKDPRNLGAPIDYHEVRGHLRLGTVQILDAGLRKKLIEGSEVTYEEDIIIRRAVLKALILISDLSGIHNPSRIHYLFWNIFRSCCTRENPHCHSCPPNCTLPDRYIHLALFPDGIRRCPFSNVCQSANQEHKLVEHRIETEYY